MYSTHLFDVRYLKDILCDMQCMVDLMVQDDRMVSREGRHMCGKGAEKMRKIGPE